MYKCRFVYYFLYFYLIYLNICNVETQQLKKCKHNYFNREVSAAYCQYGEFCNQKQFCSKCITPFDNWDKKFKTEQRKLPPILEFIRNSYKTTSFLTELQLLHEEVNNNFVALIDYTSLEKATNKELLATSELYRNLLQRFNLTKENVNLFNKPDLEVLLNLIRKKLEEIQNDSYVLKEIKTSDLKDVEKIRADLGKLLEAFKKFNIEKYFNLVAILDVLENDVILVESILNDHTQNSSTSCIEEYKIDLMENEDLKNLINELINIFQIDNTTIEASNHVLKISAELKKNTQKTKTLVMKILKKIDEFTKYMDSLIDFLKRFDAFIQNKKLLDQYLKEYNDLLGKLEKAINDYEKTINEHEIIMNNISTADKILKDLEETNKKDVKATWGDLDNFAKNLSNAQRTFEEKIEN